MHWYNVLVIRNDRKHKARQGAYLIKVVITTQLQILELRVDSYIPEIQERCHKYKN